MEIFKSKKGTDKIAYEGYAYVKSTKNLTSQNWRCDKYKAEKCRGSISTSLLYHTNREVATKTPHNHVPDPVRQELNVFLDQAVNPRRIISDMMMQVSQEAAAVAPKRKTVSRRFQRKRAKLEIEGEPEPQTIHGFAVPERFRTVRLGNQDYQFLLHDDLEGQDEVEEEDEDQLRNRIIATQRMMTLLAECTIWMLDGTFKVTPSLFYQLYTIHGVSGDWVFPCVYALLPNKEMATYSRLFQALKTSTANLNPTTCIIDFERASKQAIEAEFPGTAVHGCYFHLTQSIYRNLQSRGLQRAYMGNSDVRLAAKSLCALAFLPENQVLEAFQNMQDDVDEFEDPNLTELIYILKIPTSEGRGGVGDFLPLFLFQCGTSVLKRLMASLEPIIKKKKKMRDGTGPCSHNLRRLTRRCGSF